MKNIIALCGKSGSGKNTVLEAALENNENLHKIINYSTRPPRENEVNGVDYHFISINEFTDMVLTDELVEFSEFNGWFYGTGSNSLKEDKINIGVFSLSAIENLQWDKSIRVFAIMLDAPANVRLIRQLEREKDPNIDEIFRRYKSDEMDFCDLAFHYNYFENSTPEDFTLILTAINNIVNTLMVKTNES